MWHVNRQPHDDVIRWKHFPRYWPLVREFHRSPMNSPYKGQLRGTLLFSFNLRLNKRLNKQSWGWWFETPSPPLWRHRNACSRSTKRGANKGVLSSYKWKRVEIFNMFWYLICYDMFKYVKKVFKIIPWHMQISYNASHCKLLSCAALLLLSGVFENEHFFTTHGDKS